MSTDTIRHLAGGFLGGVLGILAFGFISSVLIPVGCFVGAVVGYGHDAIWRSMSTSWQHIPRSQFWGPHPVTRARIFATMIASVFAVLIVAQLWLFYAAALSFANMLVADGSGLAEILTIMWMIGSMLGVGFVMIAYMNAWRIPLWESNENQQAFYSTWQAWSASKVRFAGTVFLELVRAQISAMLVLLAMFCGVVVLMAYTVCTMLPMSLFFGAVKGLYIAAKRGGYWICFIVSLFVTTLMAYVLQGSLHDAKVLWITALAAGMLSAAGSEAVRHGILALEAASLTFKRWVEEPIGRRTNPVFEVMFDALADTGTYLARVVRLESLAPKFIKN